MKKAKIFLVFFILGGLGYAGIELLWRGRTHWSMMIAGGICFVIFSHIAKRYKKCSLFYKAILCAIGVTGVEFIFGLIFNVILQMKIWDYSAVPFNFLGQICLVYTALWWILGLLFIPIADRLNLLLER